jgi:hypothetical protein
MGNRDKFRPWNSLPLPESEWSIWISHRPMVNEHDENHDETPANIISLVNMLLITILYTWLASSHLLEYLS